MAGDYTRRCLWPATMAGDYTRCLWPVTTHGVYGIEVIHVLFIGK